MALNLVEISSNICFPDGGFPVGATVVAELQSPAQNDDGYVVPKPVITEVDLSGNFSLNLWPNTLGNAETYYTVVVTDDCMNELLCVVVIVPESLIPLELEDIALPVKSLSLGQSSGNVASIRRVDTGEGLAGGGDLSTNRTHKLDLTTITNEELDPSVDYIIPVQDPNSPCDIKYAKLGNLPGINITNTSVEFIAEVGQTEILLVESVTLGNIDLYIEGRRQPPARYTGELINVPPHNFKIILPEPLEGGEEIEVVIKESCEVGESFDASQVSYSGGGSVEDALNTLFTTTGATPWVIQSGSVTAVASQRFFIDTSTGPLTITLPASPSIGDEVQFIDITPSTYILGGDLLSPFIIARNGELIKQIADDLIVNQAGISLTMIYTGPSYGWTLNE